MSMLYSHIAAITGKWLPKKMSQFIPLSYLNI